MTRRDKRDKESNQPEQWGHSAERRPRQQNQRRRDHPSEDQPKRVAESRSDHGQDRRQFDHHPDKRNPRQQANNPPTDTHYAQPQTHSLPPEQPNTQPQNRPENYPAYQQDPGGRKPDRETVSGSSKPSRRTLLKGLFAASTIGIGAGTVFQNLGSNEEILLEQRNQTFVIKPLSTEKTCREFYNYSENQDPYDRRDGWGRTFTDIEQEGVSNLFLYQSPNSLCLFVIHDKFQVGAGGDPSAWLRFTGLPSFGNWFLQDDSGDFNSMFSEPPHDIRWNWIEGETDGGIFGGLGSDFNIKIEPVSFSYVDSWRFLTGQFPNYNIINLNMNRPFRLRTGTTGINTGGGGGPTTPVPGTPPSPDPPQPTPSPPPSQPVIDVQEIDFQGGCSDVRIIFNESPTGQFTVEIKVFNTATGQVEVKTFNLGPANVSNSLFGSPFVEINLDNIFPSRSPANGDEILALSIEGSDFVDNPNPCADTPGPGDGGQNIIDEIDNIDFGNGCSSVEIVFDNEPTTQFTVEVKVFNTAADQVEIKTFDIGPANVQNPLLGSPSVEISLDDIFPSRSPVNGDEILALSVEGSDFVDNPNPCANTPGPDDGGSGGGDLSSTGRIVFTASGPNDDIGNLRSVRLGEAVVNSYGVEGNVKGVGPAKRDFDSDDITETPATLANGDIIIADANGDVTTLIDSNEDNDNSGARPGTLAVGTFNGKTGIYYAAKSGNINRVKPANPPVKTTVTTAVSATSIAGIGDIDADGSNELIYGGNSPGGSSDTLNYIDQNGSVEGIGVQYGSNNGAGIGSPADFGIGSGELVPIIDGDQNISLVGPSGVETILVGGEDQTVAKKAPLTSADVDRDGSLEVVFIQPDRSIGFVDDVGGNNNIKTLGDASGDRVKVKPATGVR